MANNNINNDFMTVSRNPWANFAFNLGRAIGGRETNGEQRKVNEELARLQNGTAYGAGSQSTRIVDDAGNTTFNGTDYSITPNVFTASRTNNVNGVGNTQSMATNGTDTTFSDTFTPSTDAEANINMKLMNAKNDYYRAQKLGDTQAMYNANAVAEQARAQALTDGTRVAPWLQSGTNASYMDALAYQNGSKQWNDTPATQSASDKSFSETMANFNNAMATPNYYANNANGNQTAVQNASNAVANANGVANGNIAQGIGAVDNTQKKTLFTGNILKPTTTFFPMS